MFKISSLFISVAVIAFFVWALLPNSSNARYTRACTPVQWAGNVVVTGASFIYPEGEASTQKFVDHAAYACRFTLWRLFDEKDYLAWKKKQEEQAQQSSRVLSPTQEATQ